MFKVKNNLAPEIINVFKLNVNDRSHNTRNNSDFQRTNMKTDLSTNKDMALLFFNNERYLSTLSGEKKKPGKSD